MPGIRFCPPGTRNIGHHRRVIAAAVAAVTLAPHPLKMTAWMVFWNPRSLASFAQNAAKIDEIKPEWIGVDAEGMPFRRTHGTPEERARFFEIAKQNKVRTYAMVSNFATEAGGFDAARVRLMLNDPAKRASHIKQLVEMVAADGFDGIDLDIESLTPAERDPFSEYVEELAKAAKAKGKRLTVTVHPKEAEPGGWDGPKAQDYARIGKAADGVKIMTYDFTWAGSDAPGPIAPNDWVERVMTFAASQIPADKLDLGVAAYGYDWSTKPGASLIWEDWAARDKDAAACPRSGEQIAGPAYFSGAGAFSAKADLARKLKMRGLAMWYVGSEDPAVWTTPLFKQP